MYPRRMATSATTAHDMHTVRIQIYACMQAAVDDFASDSSVKEYVGKRGGQKSMQQAEIDALLVRYCLQVRCMRPSLLILKQKAHFGSARACPLLLRGQWHA